MTLDIKHPISRVRLFVTQMTPFTKHDGCHYYGLESAKINDMSAVIASQCELQPTDIPKKSSVLFAGIVFATHAH